jgi:hypothetical protein
MTRRHYETDEIDDYEGAHGIHPQDCDCEFCDLSDDELREKEPTEDEGLAASH